VATHSEPPAGQRCQAKDAELLRRLGFPEDEIPTPCQNAGLVLVEFSNDIEAWACVGCGQAVLDRRAREDFNTFAQLVAVDDETGQPIQQAPIHRRWAELAEQYDRLLIWAHIESGKTTQLSILRTVWELGRDPTLRFVILSNTSEQATKIVQSISNYIKNSEDVHRIFPNLVPDPDGPWTTTSLKVKRNNAAKDPSVRAVGVSGALVGSRVDRLVIDDILDQENTETEQARKKVERWVKASALTRLTKRARVLVVGTAWHPKDLLHDFAKKKNWKWFRFPVMSKTGRLTWPSSWSQARIDAKKHELGPAEFARNLLCLARDDDEARFRQEWIDAALVKGDGMQLVRDLSEIFSDGELPNGWAVFTGVDLGIKKTRRSDETVFFTFLENPTGDRRLLYIEAGKFTGPEIVDKIVDHHNRYGSLIAVENVAAQDFILQFATAATNVPVVPHTTSRAKRDPLLGVEGLAVELANGKWAFPNDGKRLSPQVEAFITEMLFYSPKTHTGDRLMAAYFAREVARKLYGNRGLPSVGLRILGGGDRASVSGNPGRDANGKTLLQRLFAVVKPSPVSAVVLAGDHAQAAVGPDLKRT
jgi:hypothetical protein